MCGIVGYVGPREAAEFLVVGLHRLEYRGYDSAGVATITPERTVRRGQDGRPDRPAGGLAWPRIRRRAGSASGIPAGPPTARRAT